MDTSEDTNDFSTKSQGFLQWLSQNGTTISSKIQLADLRQQDAGRGVVASQDISEDEELFRIPRSSILTVENSSLPAEAQEKIDDAWLSLIAAMVYEYKQNTSSKWQAYFDVLPENFDTLMFWSENDLAKLEGSAVVSKIGKVHANEAFQERIIPVLQSLLTGTDADELLNLCHRMGSTIMAYAFDLETPDSDRPQEGEDGWEEDDEDTAVSVKGMVPLADMLNADADRNNAKLFYEDDFVAMKAIKTIPAGEEIFNDYGPLPQADVLRRYGYTTQNYAQYDVVEVPLDLIKQCAQDSLSILPKDLEERVEYLDEQGVLDDGYDIARAQNEDGQFQEEFCVLLNTFGLPIADFEKLKKKDKLPKIELSAEAKVLLCSILIKRRSMYDFEHEVDTQSKRSVMARSVVQGEKAVLQEAADNIQALIDGNSKKRKASTFLEEASNARKGAKRSN